MWVSKAVTRCVGNGSGSPVLQWLEQAHLQGEGIKAPRNDHGTRLCRQPIGYGLLASPTCKRCPPSPPAPLPPLECTSPSLPPPLSSP